MKKKIITTILTIIMILTVSGVVVTPIPAHADWQTTLGCIFSPAVCTANALGGNLVTGLLSELGNLLLTISSYILSIAGIALNASIVLTMNIKAIVEGTPAVEQIWVVIRNISSIFIIFGLLYASIIKILDVEGPNLGQMVKNIVIAGLLINFSLFFTKVLIDGSNLVSLQLYRAIAPQSQNTIIASKDFNMSKLFESSYLDGGISNIFMQSLKIPSVYNNKKGLLTGTSQQTDRQLIVATLSGSVLMIFAALSFFAIAIACIIRLVILILLLGFSPVYFIGIIFPAIKGDVSDKWASYLKQQLIFLPAYLLFMYVAMRFISSNDGNGFFAALDSGRKNPGGATGTGIVSLATVGLLLQYTIAFILINIPLMAAVKLGGISGKWGENASKWLGGYMGKNTIGRVASSWEKRLEGTPRGNSAIGRALRGVTTTKLASSKFGGYSSRKDDEKINKEVAKGGREIANLKKLKLAIENGNHAEIKNLLGSMSANEIAGLSKDELANPHVVPHLSSSIYSSIEKGDKKDSDKVEIAAARTGALGAAVDRIRAGTSTPQDGETIKSIMKNMNGNDLEKMLSSTPPGGAIDPELVKHIKPSQLKDMESLDPTIRRQIGIMIRNWGAAGGISPGTNHPAYDYVSANPSLWPII